MNFAASAPESNEYNTFTPKPSFDFGFIVFVFPHLKHLNIVFVCELWIFPQFGHCITLKFFILFLLLRVPLPLFLYLICSVSYICTLPVVRVLLWAHRFC